MAEHLDSGRHEKIISPSEETVGNGPNSVSRGVNSESNGGIVSGPERKQEISDDGRGICEPTEGKVTGNPVVCEGRSRDFSVIEENLECAYEDVKEGAGMEENALEFYSEASDPGDKQTSGFKGSMGCLSLIEGNQDSAEADIGKIGKMFECGKKHGEIVEESSLVEEKEEVIEDEKNSVSGAKYSSEENRPRGLEKIMGTSLETDGKYEVGGIESEFVCKSQDGRKMPDGGKECNDCLLDVNEQQERMDCECGQKGSENHLRDVFRSKEKEEMLGICLASVPKAGNVDGEDVKREMVSHEEKCTNRKGRDGRKGLVTVDKQNELRSGSELPNVCEKGKSKRSYSRNEMEALRYLNIEEQQMRWNEIYQGLGPVVAGELDQISLPNPKQRQKKEDRQKLLGKKKEIAAVLDEVHLGKKEKFVRGVNFDISGDDLVDVGEESCTFVEEVGNEDDDSDYEYHSIQRPAFLVEGDPDFESGPPQDGLEYLRRVRWEAAQIPKVKVAKLDNSKLNREQTAYMPNIPDIAKCPEQLLPSNQWKDAFLADFSEFRQTLVPLESSGMGGLHGSPSPALVDAGSAKVSEDVSSLKSSPTVSVILSMDAVSRASMLRRRIGSLETAARLSRGDCLWIFSLCAAVDLPIDGEMGASLRCLLRKCADLRARKSEPDEEVVMLNMLVTISGKFFGQSEE